MKKQATKQPRTLKSLEQKLSREARKQVALTEDELARVVGGLRTGCDPSRGD